MLNILVTGSSRGLGLEFVRQYLQRGDRVFATCRHPESAPELQELAAQYPGKCTLLPLDTLSEESREALLAAVSSATDRIDILINNAGVNARSIGDGEFESHFTFGRLKAESILSMIHANAIAHILVTQTLLQLLRNSDSAKVMSMSSWLGSISRKHDGGNYSYSASKATLNMLNRAMAFDLRPFGITAVVANPGWVRTDMGGIRATLTAEDSVTGMIAIADRLTPGDAGRFLQWDGSEHEW